MPRKAVLRVVPASELGWRPRTDWWVVDHPKQEAHGPFQTYHAAVAASRGKTGTFGYGNIALDLTMLFPRGMKASAKLPQPE
jgi:hypothetical protein